MIDGLPETPRVAVKLSRDESGVEITIPFLDGYDDPYSYWFSQGIAYGDDPDRTERRYEPPTAISFHDVEGSVGLVGSRVSGSTRTFGEVRGEGRLRFDYAVLGAASGQAYEQINGLRSEIEGLGTWVSLRAFEPKQTWERGRLRSVNFTFDSPLTISIARRLNTSFRANWRYASGAGPDETTISGRLQVETNVKRAVDWQEHLRIHLAIRNLLRVVAWRPLDFVSHEASSIKEHFPASQAEQVAGRWLKVITDRTGIKLSAPTQLSDRDFLFSFRDVRAKGVKEWILLAQKFERGLSPLVGLLDLQGASIEAHIAQVGIGFEMLGYDLLIESGSGVPQARKMPYVQLVSVVSSAVAELLPFDADRFDELLRRTYVGVKHADRVPPDWNETLLAYLQAIQVFRAWVGLRLGVPTDRLRQALAYDPRNSQIKEITSQLL